MMSRQRTRKVPVALPTSDVGPAAWLRSIRLSGFTIAVLTLVILTVVVLAPSLRILVEQRQEIAALTAEVERQQSEVDDLEAERARWDDPSYIQSLARERLDYVYPGELSFLVIDDDSTPTDAEGLPISDDIQTTDVDWVSSLFSSVLTAALTDAPADEIETPSLETPDAPAPEAPAPEEPAPDAPAPDAPPEEG